MHRMNFHIFDMKYFKNKKEKDILNSLEVFNPDAIVMAWTYSLQGDVHRLLDGNEPGMFVFFLVLTSQLSICLDGCKALERLLGWI